MLTPFLSAVPYQFLICAALLAGGSTAAAQTTTPAPATASPAQALAFDYVRSHAKAWA